MEAEQGDGRLARHPLSNRSKEIEAHQILISLITRLRKDYDASIQVKWYHLDFIDLFVGFFFTLQIAKFCFALYINYHIIIALVVKVFAILYS